MRTITAIAGATAVLALVAGCSDSSSDDGKKATAAPVAGTAAGPAGTAEQTDRQALDAAVRKYTVALFSGDGGTGYAILSGRCREKISRAEFDTLSKQAAHDYGPQAIKTLTIDQLAGDLARVSYGIGVPQFERKAQPWAREAGTWRWDAC
ncbi:hypothetical protein [Embleya sp. NPDC059259]|uniref:hypothetical protein n=1 Tax=unclassified Embleya TaxID=2699296 RepID=UPI00369C9929